MLPTLLMTTDKDNYEAYLNEKIERVVNLIGSTLNTEQSQQGYYDFCSLKPEVYASLPEHYRMRAEFAVFHHNHERFDFGMYEPGSKPRKIILLQDFPGCTQAINQAMTWLRSYLPLYPELKTKLFGADFLCNTKGDVVISLNYHKKLDETWLERAQTLLQEHRKDACPEVASGACRYSIVAHAKKQKLTVGDDFVIETIPTKRPDGTSGAVQLKQVEGTFSQPNATACAAMLSFALSCAQKIGATPEARQDLIELYCGSGTFTVALAPLFTKVFATEVARVPTDTALFNMKLNHTTNIKLARLSALEVTQALNKERVFKRLELNHIDLDDYHFSTLLIDPPRAGLQDEAALAFTARFDHVIYISCGPESLAQDLQYLTRTHKISKVAFFDQFPYTQHLESGILLERR